MTELERDFDICADVYADMYVEDIEQAVKRLEEIAKRGSITPDDASWARRYAGLQMCGNIKHEVMENDEAKMKLVGDVLDAVNERTNTYIDAFYEAYGITP